MKVERVSKDIKAGLVVFTGGLHAWVFSEPDELHAWVFSEPDKDGLRQVYFDGEEEGKGVLLGVTIPITLGYMTQSSDVKVGRPLGVEFPDRPKPERVLISTPVTAIIVMAKKEIAGVSS